MTSRHIYCTTIFDIDCCRGLGKQIWTQSGSNWPEMGQIRVFFQVRFSTFGSIWKKSPDFPHLGTIWPTLGPNVVTQVVVYIFLQVNNNKNAVVCILRQMWIQFVTFTVIYTIHCHCYYSFTLGMFIYNVTLKGRGRGLEYENRSNRARLG